MATMSKETKAFYRLVITDASKTKRVVVWEGHSSLFNPVNAAAASNPAFESDMQKMPIIPKGVGGVLREDDYLLLEAKDDGSTQSQIATAAAATFRLRIPITVRNRRTGIVTERVLGVADMNLTTDFNAADMSATFYREIGYWQVPAQNEAKVGLSIAHNSRILIGFGDTVGAA